MRNISWLWQILLGGLAVLTLVIAHEWFDPPVGGIWICVTLYWSRRFGKEFPPPHVIVVEILLGLLGFFALLLATRWFQAWGLIIGFVALAFLARRRLAGAESN